MLERFPPPATICVAGNISNLRLPPIQTVWGRMLPMHTQLTSGPAPAPAPATIKTHYQTSAHPLYRKLLPRSSLSDEVLRPMAPVLEWDSPLPQLVVELLRQHTRGRDPKPNMCFKGNLYHRVLCPFEEKKDFARVKVFRKHLVEKNFPGGERGHAACIVVWTWLYGSRARQCKLLCNGKCVETAL